MEENEEFDSDFNTENIPISEEFWNYMENYWHNHREFPESTEISLSKKADLINGKVPSSQLPSYVDDVLEFDTFTSLPSHGEKGKIYLITNNNTQFRWSGTEYIQLNSDKNFVTTNTDQRIDGKKSFITAGGSGSTNHSLRVYSNDRSNPGMTFYKEGVDIATMYFDGTGNFKFRNSDDTVSRYLFAQGFKKDGSSNARILLGDGSDRAVSDFSTVTTADAKYIPYTGATTNINLNAKPIANAGSIDATVFRNTNSSLLVKSFSLHNTTSVTSLGVKLTSPNTSNMMGSFTVTIFGYVGQTLSFRVSMYKYQYNWFNPTITWLHGDSAKVSNIEFYKEDDSNLHLKVNFVTNFGAYNKTVITDVLANGQSEVLHNPDTYTISINPDNSSHTLQVTSVPSGFVRDSILPANANHITTNTAQSGLTGDKNTSGAWTFNNNVIINRNNLTSILSYSFRTNNLLRWAFYTNAETGSNNSGGNFTISRYSDTGSYLSDALTIFRDSGAVRLSNLAGTGIRMVTANATGDLSTQTMPLYGYYSTDNLMSRQVSSVATTLDSELPNGGFISSYSTSSWGGSDRPTGASYGGYIKFARGGGSDINNLDFYYNNGHNDTESKLWFRTKDGAGINSWLEVATREWVNLQLSANYISNTHVINGITSTNISNWNSAFNFTNNFVTNYNDLVAIEALSGTDGYLRKDGNGQWSLVSSSVADATSTVSGKVKLFSNTVQTITSNPITTTASRTYGIQLNPNGQMVVNVPWVDTNTTYSNGAGLNLSGTTFSVNFGTAAGTAAQGNDSRINNGQTAFGWGNHATAGYATQSWIDFQDYVNQTFVEEKINDLTGEIVDPTPSFFIKNEFTTVILTENYSKEPLELERELIPGRYISIINLSDGNVDLSRDHNTIDTIYEKETSEYYITEERRLVKKGAYKSAKTLI